MTDNSLNTSDWNQIKTRFFLGPGFQNHIQTICFLGPGFQNQLKTRIFLGPGFLWFWGVLGFSGFSGFLVLKPDFSTHVLSI